MSDRDRERELLVEFCAYCDRQPQEEALDDCDLIDAFLASRQPQSAPATEQRYWRVFEEPGEGWWLEEVDATGKGITRRGDWPRPTRTEAEADGTASGLERWDGGGK